MRRVRFTDQTVRHGDKSWTVSGVISFGRVELALNRLHGSVSDLHELNAALASMVASKPRYARVLNGDVL